MMNTTKETIANAAAALTVAWIEDETATRRPFFRKIAAQLANTLALTGATPTGTQDGSLFRNLEALELLGNMRSAMDDSIEETTEALRASGASWSQIGARLGMSKQAAQQHYGKR